MKKGISIIALVIIIIVMITIAGVVFVMFTDNNPISKAKQTVFQDKVSKYKEDMVLYKTSNNLKSIDNTYLGDLKEIIPNLIEEDIGKFAIEEEKLIYTGRKEEEAKWASEIDVYTSKNIVPEKEKNIDIKDVSTIVVDGIETPYTYLNIHDKDAKTFVKFDEDYDIVWKLDNYGIDYIYEEEEYIYAVSYSYNYDHNITMYKIDKKEGKVESTKDLNIKADNVVIKGGNNLELYCANQKEGKVKIAKIDKEKLEVISEKDLEISEMVNADFGVILQNINGKIIIGIFTGEANNRNLSIYNITNGTINSKYSKEAEMADFNLDSKGNNIVYKNHYVKFITENGETLDITDEKVLTEKGKIVNKDFAVYVDMDTGKETKTELLPFVCNEIIHIDEDTGSKIVSRPTPESIDVITKINKENKIMWQISLTDMDSTGGILNTKINQKSNELSYLECSESGTIYHTYKFK